MISTKRNQYLEADIEARRLGLPRQGGGVAIYYSMDVVYVWPISFHGEDYSLTLQGDCGALKMVTGRVESPEQTHNEVSVPLLNETKSFFLEFVFRKPENHEDALRRLRLWSCLPARQPASLCLPSSLIACLIPAG